MPFHFCFNLWYSYKTSTDFPFFFPDKIIKPYHQAKGQYSSQVNVVEHEICRLYLIITSVKVLICLVPLISTNLTFLHGWTLMDFISSFFSLGTKAKNERWGRKNKNGSLFFIFWSERMVVCLVLLVVICFF